MTQQPERDLKAELDAFDTFDPVAPDAWAAEQPADAVKDLGLDSTIATEVEAHRRDAKAQSEKSFFRNMLDSAVDTVTSYRERMASQFEQNSIGGIPFPGGVEGLDLIAGLTTGVSVEKAAKGEIDEFTKARNRGLYNTLGSFAGGVEQYGKTLGVDGVADYAAERKQSFQDKAEKSYFKPRIQGLKDISKESWFTDTVDYVVSGVGEGLGSSAPFFAAGAVGGLPLAGAFGYTSSVGELRDELVQSGVTDEATVQRYAYIAAVPHAILDQLTERGVVKNLTDEAKREVTKGIVRTIVKSSLKGGTKEGVTEAAQRVIELGAVAHANGGEAPNAAVVAALFADVDKGVESTILESGVKGFLPGTVFGAGEVAADRLKPDQVQEARVRTPRAMTDAAPVELPADARPVAPMTDGPAQPGAPSVQSEPVTFTEPELEAARRAILDAAQALPVEVTPEGQQPQAVTAEPVAPSLSPDDAAQPLPTEGDGNLLMPEEVPESPAVDESAPPGDDDLLDLPAVFADIETYIQENEIDVAEVADETVRAVARAVYEGEDLGVAVDRALGLEPTEDAEQQPEPVGVTDDVRSRFAEVLASTTPRSQWAEAANVDPETLNALIDEAVADGRMEIRFGKPVRKAAARVSKARPERQAATASAPTMLRSEEKRLEAVRSDKAYTAAADLFNARGTPESFQAALDRLYSDKSVKNADLAQAMKAFTGRRTKPKNRADAIKSLDQAYKAWAAKGDKKNAKRGDVGQEPGSVPEGRLPDEVRDDAGGRDTEGTPDGGGQGRPGDVGGRGRQVDDGTGSPDRVRGPGEEIRAGAGDRPGDGEPRADTQPDLAPPAPRERTAEEIAALEADLAADLEEAEAQRRDRTSRNYKITDADKIGQGGPKQKVRANIAAIETLKKIEEEGRPATDEEKAVLVKYVGWGAFSQPIFKDYNQEFAKERAALKTLLTPEEYKSARDSTINAHYTSPEVIKGMWSALEHLGFKGGRVLEPSVGIGHFIGLQPESMAGNSSWTAVDLDTLSGRITKALYGAADVRIGGYEQQIWPNDHFDLAISNVPFAKEGPYDPAYKQKFTLHDYFFVKSLDKVRPGGIVAFITSSGTLDKARDQARREMEKRGTFLGAIRLPGGNKGAFKANAGTDVTTDIIFFRKKMQGEPIDINAEWTDTQTIKTPEGDTDINGYFAKNPDMMLGKMRLIGTMHHKGEPVLIGPTEDMDQRIAQAAKALPENAMTDRSTVVAPVDEVDTATDGIKEGAFYEKDGKIFRKIVGVGVPQKLNKQDAARVRAFLPIRDVVNEMLAKQASGNKTGMDDLRAALSASYDAFVKEFGPINLTNVTTQTRKSGKVVTIKRMPNFAVLQDDMDAYKVAAIESYDAKTSKATKTAIFTEDLLKPYVRPAITGPADALTVSLNEAGRVDMKLIASVLGVSEKRAAQELGDAVFLNPKGEQWQTATQYLSGDVVTKLADAKAAADLDPKYGRNVAALEAVQPIPLTRNEITIPLGASYVPEDVINAFLSETLEAPGVQATLNPATKSWTVRFTGGLSDAARAQWAISSRDVSGDVDRETPDVKVGVGEIVEAALNSKPIQVYTTIGGERIRMPKAEELARAKVTMLKEAFTGQIYPGAQAAIGGWVWNDEARATRMEAVYNNAMNRLVKEQHDGSHLTFPGLARVVSFPDGTTGTINLPAARTGAIWRIIQNGNTLIDHVVGAGKTWTSIMAVQEMKRLGQIRRPMFVVPNHMLMQFSAEFLQAYPGAKLLVATKDSMSKAKRAEFAAKAAAERWDGIIITHSAFSRLKMRDDAYKDYYEEIVSQMESAKKGEGDATVKDIVKAQKRIKAKLDSLIKKESKDQGVTFEELGIDHITVDEAHLFKNLWFMTRHTRVKGISNSSESQRATDLYIKIRHLEKSRPGRSALFLTGTPLSNTMAEVYTMMRYLQRPTLEEYDIAEFDSWAQTFGMIDTRTELASNAKDYTDITSFSKFVNIPELSTLYGRIADTQTAESLGLQRPAIKGGMPQVIMSEPSPIERSLLDTIIEEMERLKGSKPEKGAPNFLSMFTKGLQASTDARLVDPSAPYNPDGKIGKAVDNIYRIWEEGNKDPAKPDKAQVVFLDMGVPGSRATAKPMKPGTGADENVIDVDPLEAVRQGLADTGNEIVDEAEDGEELQPEANEDDAAVESMMAGKFNLYEDIKGHLVEKGMPADQIAFIHDAKNDDQKAKMFEAVREGKIRVLIGSTGKMGVGTNVQKRLVALHHIDAPWRPSDLEQRDGRILRQGNLNPEIQIYRYITQRSFEAYRWQILERKASFIAQFRAGARGLRIAEDIDSPLPDASEIKAAATGDSRIVEMADMERTVRGLLAQASAHAGVAVRARQALANVKSTIERVSKRISILESDAARVTDLKGDAFKITANLPGGKTAEITERKKFGEALKRYITTLAANAWYGREIDIEFGTISGFDVAGVVKKGPDGIEVRPEIRGSETYRAKSAFFLTDETSPVSIAQSYERLVSGVPDLLADAKSRLASEEAQIPGLQAKTVATAFPKQAELEEKQKRLVELQEALKPKKKVVPGSDEDLAARGAKALADMQTPEYLAAIDAAPERDTSLVPGFMSPEWKAARTYNTPEGEIVGYEEGLQHFVANAVKRTPAKPRQERKVFVLLGMAGSGKSTIAKSIGEAYGAAHIVADDVKPMIPEYDQGRNSAGVHEESAAMAGDATGRLARTGYNLIIEKIGSSTGSIRKIVELFKNAGYRVNLLFVNVPKEIAMERAVKRWRKTGRAVPMESYTSLDIPGVYDNISSEGNVDENAIIRWNEETGSWINEGTGPDIGQLRFGSGATETVQSRVGGLDRNEVPRRSFEEVKGPGEPALNDSGAEVGADETGQTPMFSLAGLYHGSLADIQYDQQGRLLVDPALFGSRTGLGEQAFFLTPNVTLASRYAEGEGGRVYRAVVETENFEEVKGWNWRQEPERVRQTIESARAAGKDGVLFRGMQDGTGIVGDQYAVINPQAIRAFDGSLFEGRKLGLMTGNTYADTALEWANNDVAEAMATLQRQRDLGKATRKATWSKADEARYSKAFEALKTLDPSVSSPARKSKIMSLFGMASIAGGAAQQTSENLVVADAGTQERLLKMPSQRLRAHARGLSEAGLDRAALDAAIDAIGKDRGLVAKDWVAIAQAYTAGPVDGESAAAAVKAIRKAFAERVHDLSLAELGGFDPAVSASNLDWRPEARAALSALAARLPGGTGFTVRNFIEIATRSSSMRQGLEIEGGMFTPEQAERQLGLDPRSARKIMAISLAYGPDVALQTFTHEEIHAVREFLTDKEWGVLSKLATRKPKKSEALRLIDIAEQNGKVTPQYAEFMRANAGNVTYREIYGIDNRYGRLGLKEDKLVEEVVAHAAADWADGHDFGTRIERVMMKIRDLIEAFGNLLRGNGFYSVDSIFRSVWSGEVAKRSKVPLVTLPGGVAVRGYPILSIRAFHGSPHNFDRFDMSKIGTGEGAQAFGHGLYFAESEGVARSYRDALSGGRSDTIKSVGGANFDINSPEHVAAYYLKGMSPKSALQDIRSFPSGQKVDGVPIADDVLSSAGALIESGAPIPRYSETRNTGHMYQVRINANPEDFLDWDKPLSQQSDAVRSKFFDTHAALVAEREKMRPGIEAIDTRYRERALQTFEQELQEARDGLKPFGFYAELLGRNNQESSNRLRELGIPGIRYLDQMSRSAGKGSYNYVVFEDNIIEITHIDGVPVGSTTLETAFSLAGTFRRAIGRDRTDGLWQQVTEIEKALEGASEFSLEGQKLRARLDAIKAIIMAMDAGAGRYRGHHMTPAKFDKFDNRYTDEVGFHFGSKSQARNRAYIMSGGNPFKYWRWRRIDVDIEIKKPLSISSDPGSFAGLPLAYQMYRDGHVPLEFYAAVENAPEDQRNDMVRNWLTQNGYDAVKYPNTYEGPGDTSIMTMGTGNVRDAYSGDVLYSLPGDENTATLNQAIDGLKRALGIHISQNLFGVTIKSGDKYVRINPRANIRGQTSRATGGVGVRRSRDIRAIAHEGGHSLELMLGEGLDAIKATFAKSLVTPFAPDLPMPNLAQSGYAGLELDDVEQAALVDAVAADKDLRDWSTRVGNAKSTPLLLGRVQYDDAQYRAVERKAAFMRANLVRLVGEKRADALIDDVRQKAPANPPQFVRERFSPMGAPKRRLTPAPAGDALSEAFARWFEKYVMARESAEEMAPEFFAAFEDLLEAEAPSVLEGLHTVQATYKAWTKRATVEELASDVVSVTADNTWKAIADGRRTITQTISGRMAEAYTAVIDDLAPMQAVVRKLLAVADRNGVRDESGRPISLKVSENPYKIARMFRGSYATGYTWIKDGISNYGSERIAYPGLQRAMETIFGGQVWDQRVYQAFGQYLISKRAIAEFDRLAAKTKRLADIESILKTGGESWRVTSTQQAKDREVLARRQDALDRVSVLAYDRTRALRVARSAERRMQERMQELRDDLAESLRAIDDGSDAAKVTRDRKRRALQVAERDARRARNDVVDAELELTNLETDQALLRAEVAQIEQRLEQRQTSLDALEDAIGLMRRERDATAKRGASRPPTLESREWHEAFLAKVASDKRYEKFEEAAQTVYAFTHGLLTVRYQAGLIPEELYRELSGRKDWYVPFMRDMSDAEPETVFMGASARAWSPFKKFDGSDRAIINPLEIISQEAYATAQHIAMNEAVGALDALAQKAGPGSAAIVEKLERTEGMENTPETWQRIRDIAISMGIDEADATLMVQRMEMNFANEDLQALWSPSTKGPIAKPALPLWENGVRRHVVINDAEFGADALQAMMGLGKEQMHWLLEMFGKPARLLQIGVTTHPTFMPRNLIRDVFDAWIKTGALPVVTQVRGARALLGKDGEFLRQYTAAGGILGGRNIAALTSKEQQANLIDMDPNAFQAGSAILGSVAGLLTGSIMAGPLGGMAGTVIGYAGARHGGLLKMVEAVESMTRLGVAAEAYKRALVHNPSLSQDEAMLEAAYVARDVFDWNRRGSKTLGLVRMITFLNAQIQGLDRAARAIGGSGDRGSAVAKRLMMVYRREHDTPLSLDEQRDLGDAYKTYARLALYTALLLGLYAMYRDDDQYEDIKDRTKATHSWLPGLLGVDVRIPKAFEWAIPSNFVEVLWDKMEGRDPRVGERMLKSAQEVLVPPGVPQALNLAVGWTTNTDLQSVAPWLFGEDADKVNRKIVPDYLKGLSPEAQFDAFTSQLSKDVALAMAKAGVPESSIPSPKMIDFTLRTGGYWGQDIGKAYQAIKEGAGYPAGPQPRVPDWPIVGGFTGISARQSKSVDELYRLMSQQGGDFVTAANTYKNMLDKAGNPAEAEAFLGRLEPESRAYAILAYHFTTADKRRHPLERASAVAKVTRDIRKEVVLDRLAPMKRQGRKTVYDRENAIALLPKERTVIMDIMERLAQAESWNGFVALGREGWTGKTEMAVQPILDELKAANEDVHTLYMERLDKAKVEPFDRVRSEWPVLREDLLRNGADALLDGKSGVKTN